MDINVSDEYAASFFRLDITSTLIIEEKYIHLHDYTRLQPSRPYNTFQLAAK
jgi:hypothetical protein